jgi:hypothetical protein
MFVKSCLGFFLVLLEFGSFSLGAKSDGRRDKENEWNEPKQMMINWAGVK